MQIYPADQARVRCDVPRIRELLRRNHWTQRHLATLMAGALAAGERRATGGTHSSAERRAAGDPVASARRSVARALRGENVTVKTAERLAQALNVGLGEIITLRPEDATHVPTVLQEIRCLDQAGQFDRAITLGCALLEQRRRTRRSGQPEDPWYGEVCVQLATVYDHRADWVLGIRLLNDYLRTGKGAGPHVDLPRLWARYQRAVLRRNQLVDRLNRSGWRLPPAVIAAGMAACHADLDFVYEIADEEMRIAVDHQRGVLAQLRGDFASALALFESARERRERLRRVTRNTAGRYRLAYEHRRIAHCLAHLGRDPRPDLRSALRLARAERHERLLRELQADQPVLLAVYQAARESTTGPRASAERSAARRTPGPAVRRLSAGTSTGRDARGDR